jgi:predicted RNA-binding Zn-ribbon protein involved in translation (DUF1610 family)
MILFEPTTSWSSSMAEPDCPKCGASMWLFGVEAEYPGHELLSFDCPSCQHIETRTRKSETMQFLRLH